MGCKYTFFVSQTRKNVDKYKNVVAYYIKIVDEYIFRLQSSIFFMGCKYNFFVPQTRKNVDKYKIVVAATTLFVKYNNS